MWILWNLCCWLDCFVEVFSVHLTVTLNNALHVFNWHFTEKDLYKCRTRFTKEAVWNPVSKSDPCLMLAKGWMPFLFLSFFSLKFFGWLKIYWSKPQMWMKAWNPASRDYNNTRNQYNITEASVTQLTVVSQTRKLSRFENSTTESRYGVEYKQTSVLGFGNYHFWLLVYLVYICL